VQVFAFFATGSVITVGHAAVCILSVAARNEERVAHRTSSTFPQGEKADSSLCWHHRSYLIPSRHRKCHISEKYILRY
jgi:hypothetical protein